MRTVEATKQKAQAIHAYDDYQPEGREFKTPQPAKRKATVDNIRDMDAKGFIKTDMNEYLEKDAHVYCISCVNCLKHKHNLVQYKYNPSLKSNYA